MKIRMLALALAFILLMGAVSPSVGYAFACRLSADEMPVSCPMREKATPAASVESSKPTEHSCCDKAKAEPKKAAPQHDISGTCCCDMTAAPERSELPALVPTTDAPVFVLATRALTPIPALVVTAALELPAYDEDAPRGPPRTSLSPRAPPLSS